MAKFIDKMVDGFANIGVGVVKMGDKIAERMEKRLNSEPNTKTLLAEDLQELARRCQERYPEIKAYHVVCLPERDKRRYKIVALMLDANGKAVEDKKGDYVGKIFYAKTLGERVKELLNGADGGDFTVSLERQLAYRELLDFISESRREYPQVCGASLCRVWLEKEKRYEAEALALDSEGKAVKVVSQGKEAWVGRRWLADSFDETLGYRFSNEKSDTIRIFV